MRLILVLIFLNAFCSYSQVWKEPFDTISYYDCLTRLSENHLNVRSYSIAQFDSSGTPVQFDYYEFNPKGYLIKECMGVSADQKLDTIRYYYNESGVFQEAVYPGGIRQNETREFIKDSRNRTTAISSLIKDSVFTTYFYYSDKLDSIVYPYSNTVRFKYNEQGQLSKKSIVEKGQLKGYFNYYYPEKNVITYCDCIFIKVYDKLITACDSTIGTFNKSGKLAGLEMYVYKFDSPDYMNFEYDKNGDILKIRYKDVAGNSTTNYIRNREGLLTRIEHRNGKGRVYNYSDFKYQYR
ncbi:MAG: hypothetical protein ACO1N0_11005 [Fluviicola sp.]